MRESKTIISEITQLGQTANSAILSMYVNQNQGKLFQGPIQKILEMVKILDTVDEEDLELFFADPLSQLKKNLVSCNDIFEKFDEGLWYESVMTLGNNASEFMKLLHQLLEIIRAFEAKYAQLKAERNPRSDAYEDGSIATDIQLASMEDALNEITKILIDNSHQVHHIAAVSNDDSVLQMKQKTMERAIVLYEEGLALEHKKKFEEAIAAYKESARLSHVKAHTNLANLLLKKTELNYEEKEKTKEEAFNLTNYAAEKKHQRAELNLAMMYRDGCGIPIDKNQAAFWFNKAAGNHREHKANIAAIAMEKLQKLSQ